jgi:hypothetical protein
MYGKTNMERAVQMVAILVEIKFGEDMAILSVYKVPTFAFLALTVDW